MPPVCRVAGVLSVRSTAGGGRQADATAPDCRDSALVQAGSAGVVTSMNRAEISPWRGLSSLSPDRWCQEALGAAPGRRYLRRPISIDRGAEPPADVRVTERAAWGWIRWEVDIPGLVHARAEGGDLARTARQAVRLREIIVRRPGLDSPIVQAQTSAAADPLQIYSRGLTQDLGTLWAAAAAGIAGGLATSALLSPWPLVDAVVAAAGGVASWTWWKRRGDLSLRRLPATAMNTDPGRAAYSAITTWSAAQSYVDVPQVRAVTQEAAQQLLWAALDPDPMIDPREILFDAHALREAIAAAELAGRFSDSAAFGGQLRPTSIPRPAPLSRTRVAQDALDALGGLTQAHLDTAMLTRRFTSGADGA